MCSLDLVGRLLSLELHALANAFHEVIELTEGRPARVRLLVLIDRGHRELPVEAQFIGRMVQTTDIEIIEVKFQETDSLEKVLLVEKVVA